MNILLRSPSCLLLGVLVSIFDCHGAIPAADDVAIDQRVALKVGSYVVSDYVIEKYYGRYAASVRRQSHRDPSIEESRAWLEQFVAKQCVIAQAKALGYLDRPEVVENVARMERHMLTQSGGPFYERLFGLPPLLSDAELRILFEQSHNLKDCIVVRFPNDQYALGMLGSDFAQCHVDEQTRRVLGCRAEDGVEMIQGFYMWPYAPFIEIADAVAEAPVGRWIRHSDAPFGAYFIYIRSSKPRPTDDFAAHADSFRSFNGELWREKMRRHRLQDVLVSAKFELDQSNASCLAHLLSNLTVRNDEIPEGTIHSVSDLPLFRFLLGANERSVTVGQFCSQFNERLIRSMPRTAEDLRTATQEMAVEECDYSEAKHLGIDRTAKFAEDRAGFAGLVVLELYEKEVLVPQLTVGATEIERYYNEHFANYRSTNKVYGRLLQFDSLDKAVQWRQCQTNRNKNQSGESALPVSDQEVELGIDRPIEGLESVRDAILGSADGTTLGPIGQSPRYFCFTKERDLDVKVLPLKEAAKSIRDVLMRHALDIRELELANEVENRREFENHIDYPRYAQPLAPTQPSS